MRIFLSLVFACSFFLVQAQLAFNTNTLVFPATNELQNRTGQVTVYNTAAYPITITDVDLFNLYNQKPFTVSTTSFTIAAGDSTVLDVDFTPRHNVYHDLALVLKTNSGFGHKALLLKGQGYYSKTYYAPTQNQTEEALKIALKNRLAQGYNSLSYSVARDNMYASIDNTGGSVECVYTGRTANFNTRSGANANNFNCEHTFPQGFFNQNLPMRSDIHHLFPTDVSANSRRGNDPFDVVSNASWSVGGSKSGGGKFEPRNLQKGATARAMMYFVIRYQDYANHFQGQENLLRGWHKLYPPSAAEQSRNNAIFNLQNNRNPFVDYPQFEERITSFVGSSIAQPIEDLYFSDDTVFLAQGSGVYDFNFVIFNNGTNPVTLNNIQVNDPNLAMSTTSVTVQPGEAAELKIAFDASLNYNTKLEFDDNRNPVISYSIPVISGPALSSHDFESPLKLALYPNPVEDELRIRGYEKIESIAMCDLGGNCQTIKPKAVLDLSNMAPGFYIVSGMLKSGDHFQQKLLVR